MESMTSEDPLPSRRGPLVTFLGAAQKVTGALPLLEDAAYLNIQRNYPEPSIEPLYTRYDVDRVLSQVVAIDYDRPREVRRGLTFRFLEAGHVLGSAMIHVKIDDEESHTLTFTGDLGRRSLPLLRHTAPIPAAEVLVCESTYGNRTHEPIAVTADKLYDAINRTID